jgi:PAS domain-containing protein
LNRKDEAVNEANELAMLMLDTSPLCAQIWDRSLNTIDCNNAAVRLYGFKSKQEYVDRFITSCSPEYQPDGQRSDVKAVRLVNQAFEEGLCVFDWMHKMPDDDILIPAEITLVRAKHRGDDVVIGYTRDIPTKI